MPSDAAIAALRDMAHHICLEIISEASRRLPGELKARHPLIAWKDMAGAGNVYRHNYEDVAARLVWTSLPAKSRPSNKVSERGDSKSRRLSTESTAVRANNGLSSESG